MPIPVRDLTADRIQAEINFLSADHSPKTVRNGYGLIRATLSLFAPDLHFRVTLPQNKKIEYHVPTTEQIYEMIEHASKNLKIAIMLAAFCGLRRGEIAALKAEDISGNIIHVKSAAVLSDGVQIEKAPKTFTSDRYVPAPDFVIQSLPKKGKVCPLSLNSITHRFSDLRTKLGYQCRFHDLRHYYASALHAIGIRDQYIMKFGGWKSDAVLKSVYRGTLDDFEIAAAEQATSYFEKNFH
jgi:integrase